MASNQGGGIVTLPMSEVQVKENLKYWENRYKTRCFQWHIDQVHPQLLKYLGELTNLGEGKQESLKFFVPLCGKSKDIPFLLSLGFEVFGIEVVASVIQEFSKENDIELEFDEGKHLYSSKDGKLKIYCEDMFKCPIEEYGPFDCIWDRASFIALDYAFRPAYMDVVKRSVAHGIGSGHKFRYLIQTVKYDKNNFNGPPKCVDAEDFKEHFESWAKVTVLESSWVPHDHPCRQVNNYYGDDFFEEFHLIEPHS